MIQATYCEERQMRVAFVSDRLLRKDELGKKKRSLGHIRTNYFKWKNLEKVFEGLEFVGPLKPRNSFFWRIYYKLKTIYYKRIHHKRYAGWLESSRT